jgi:hypothetical protein
MLKIQVSVKIEGQRVTLSGENLQSKFFDTVEEAKACYEAVKLQIEEAEKKSQ